MVIFKTMENQNLTLDQLFYKIENCNKWICIHKNNRNNPDFESSFCNEEIKRITNMKECYQEQFDDLYKKHN